MAQAGVSEPWWGQLSAKVTLSSPHIPLLRTQSPITAPFPNQGRMPSDCQRPRPCRDGRVSSRGVARQQRGPCPRTGGHESGWAPEVEGQDICWRKFSCIQRRGRAVWPRGPLFPHLGGGRCRNRGAMRQRQPRQIPNCHPPFSFSRKHLPLFEAAC